MFGTPGSETCSLVYRVERSAELISQGYRFQLMMRISKSRDPQDRRSFTPNVSKSSLRSRGQIPRALSGFTGSTQGTSDVELSYRKALIMVKKASLGLKGAEVLLCL